MQPRHNHKRLEINTLEGSSVEGNRVCYMQEKKHATINTNHY